MLTMQPPSTKLRIVAEAARLLAPGGRYGIHELCIVPDEIDQATRNEIELALSGEVHVGVRPLTAHRWRELLESCGMRILAEHVAPLHLLEPRRLVRDEGLWHAVRFVWNVARDAPARRRDLAMRRIFRKYRRNLAAISLIAAKADKDCS